MVKLKALKQLTGTYGTVKPGEVFQMEDAQDAETLVKNGSASRVGGSDRSNRKGAGATETKSRASGRRAAKKAAKSSAKKSASKPSGTTKDFTTANYRGTDAKTGDVIAGDENANKG